MKILYAAPLSLNDSALYRMAALQRLEQTVIPLNSLQYRSSSALLQKIVHRVQMGPTIKRLNSDILAIAEQERVDVFWADKLLGLQPETLEALRRMGIQTVSYMIDNAFGSRRDPGWRLYMQDIPHFDLHVVQRDSNIADLKARGAGNVIKIQTAYEPTLHFPPPGGWDDSRRDRGVSFIGTSYDDRPAFLTKLWRECRFPVTISGDRMWKARLDAEAATSLYTGSELYGADYREAIWRSKINLSFLTHSNADEFAHKSFEISACGGFLLAEWSEGHAARFTEDEEAVFFRSFAECAEKIRQYLSDAAGRERIAAAGRNRAVRSGYSNDTQMGLIVKQLGERSKQSS